MLACLCCKKGGIGFKEFENAEGDEYVADVSAQGSPATAQNGPDVYVLPLTEVSLPMAKQPGRSVQLLKSTDLGRHSLLYLKEIGHGWFGKVFLGEVNSGVSSAQVVVKELKASASVQEQMQFLEEVQPYRALQHSNLLQCLAQCAEVTPYLLVMEFCPLGDLKGYLRSCRVTESMAPDPLTLQRMACEVACGVLHLHRNNYVHSDLALRNCLLTADLTVKIGDYGLSHCKYREDYFVTADQLWVPLRWIAPELVDEVHSNLLVVDQTKSSNVWSLGVTIWELFELGTQPYPQHSDRQVLAYAVREQQLKLPKPQLQLTLSDRWYEVMQFCWLQPEQRPTAEEVHLLLTYLCAKGATEAEEEFEQRWRSLRPGSPSPSPSAGALMGAGRGAEEDWGVAAFCPPFFEDPLGATPTESSGARPSLPGEGEPGETGPRRAAQHGHWRSNVSANNNSGSRSPEFWDPGSYTDDCPSPKQTPRASPELGHPLAQENPREPLLGLQAASPAQEPDHCLNLPHMCSAQGSAPATCLVTSPWTEAPVSGGDNSQAEPKLAEEAEGSTGPHLPLPSVPSPSQEGAPLLSEEASAPDTLPDSPTPAASTLDSSSSSPGVEAPPSSEDEDITEATSGVFTDVSSDALQAEKLDVVPAFRSLQKQVGTPDSLDSLDIPSSASDGGCEVFSPSADGTPAGQPRALDSGYDTENYESPEFVLKEAHEPCEPKAFGELALEGESPRPDTGLSTSLGGLSEKNPYRDSAYFSDLDAESEPPLDSKEKLSEVQALGPEPGLKSLQSPGQQSVQASPGPEERSDAQGPGPREGSSPEPRACPTGPGPAPESQGSAEALPVPSPSRSKFFLLTPVLPGSQGDSSELQGAPGLLSGMAPPERMGGPGTPRPPLCLALPALPAALEGRPEEEEEDSEDSDESDEELRCYSIQEPSEESEEEAPAVPVVVAESQSARNLRSLLKMPSLLSEAFCEDLERKKKAVSFFDDVTVYLFDQVGRRCPS
ncbi:serine/threonine-protein kinase LMTK1, partial [Carlito syrichta]|uniref:non-specific serine/threonine protein kinase n=1 Tax=Carlito syrichta TaxID=1868482 RepID=A0A3Q0DRK6_CARSF